MKNDNTVVSKNLINESTKDTIIRLVEETQFGQVIITIQDGKVVMLEKDEKYKIR